MAGFIPSSMKDVYHLGVLRLVDCSFQSPGQSPVKLFHKSKVICDSSDIFMLQRGGEKNVCNVYIVMYAVIAAVFTLSGGISITRQVGNSKIALIDKSIFGSSGNI